MRWKAPKTLTHAIALAAILTLALPWAALADNVVTDGDGDLPVSNSPLNLGTICVGVSTSATALIAISRNGNYGTSNVFQNGAVVTISAESSSSDLSATGGTIKLPDNWDTVSNNVLSESVASTVTLTPSATGAFNGTITYTAEGPGFGPGNNNPIPNMTRTGTLTVTATVQDCAPADTIPPTTTIQLSGTTGNNDWFISPVEVTLTATDNDGGSGVAATYYQINNGEVQTYSGAFMLNQDGIYEIRYWSEDNAGNVEEAQENIVTIKIDQTAPYNITGGPDRAPDHNGWYNKPVTIVFTGQDDVSGIDSCTEVTYGGPDGAGVTVSGVCTDVAGNTGGPVASSPFNYDATAPTDITFIGALLDGMEYYWGDTPPEPTCTATDTVSGLASCEVTGYSTAVGEHTLTATATDNAGNTATKTLTYTVKAWTLSGFFQPVDMGTYNTVKGGSTVPLKFQVFKGTTEVTSPAAIASITATAFKCEAGVPSSDAEEWAATTGATELRYTGGQFMYNWKTPKTPGVCYKVTVTTQDGSKLTALFTLK